MGSGHVPVRARCGSADLACGKSVLLRRPAAGSLLSHRFVRLRDCAGLSDAALHRFRHTVATSLVEHGITKAQARLGHRGTAATTLRHYAHATPLDDLDVVDESDRRLNAGPVDGRSDGVGVGEAASGSSVREPGAVEAVRHSDGR